jgi:hypothetical protein
MNETPTFYESYQKISETLNRMDKKLDILFKDLKVTLEKVENAIDEKSRYRVLFCGDRSTAVQFEETITMELKKLPKNSIVIHGGKRGIDTFSELIAKQLNIETEMVDNIDYSTLDLVLAFHPDIVFAEDTKKIILKAWKANIPVFIHDLKRKSKFEGDFYTL